MTFLDLVKQRYSCRSYQEKSVEPEKVDYVMECVRFAPSAVNKQPWKFHIVKNDADKAKCLAATEQGLATCWVCNFDAAKCKKLFGIQDAEEPAVLIPIGYAADEPKEKKRKEKDAICK